MPACTDQFDAAGVSPEEEKKVDVWLDIEFAGKEEGAVRYAQSEGGSAGEGASEDGARSGSYAGKTFPAAAFQARLEPPVATKAAAAYPDKLYNLEIRQYDLTTGVCMNTSSAVLTEQATGDKFSVSLTASEGCRLVFVAWGTSATTRLGTGTFTAARNLTIAQSTLKNLDPASPDDMNKMPYLLCLPHVKITADGKIQNPDGTDVRVLLQRLAARVSFSWNYQVTAYALKQIRLESVPADYKIIPDPDGNGTYPSLFDQYTILSVPESDLHAESTGKGSYACWIPASVRGSRTNVTSPLYRTKSNAPTGSLYATFIAENTADSKQKLNYRLYLGGNTTTDFNLYANTDYRYTVDFQHTGLPVNDGRVTIVDPIPASENNENFVPTANCFLVAPGGAFCFNPYKFYREGKVVENALLQDWCTTDRIRSVKVDWQTKENGDVGDPVLGVVNLSAPGTADDDHTNIVDLANGQDFETARIYCRVASNTTGGSGLIAAYAGPDGTGTLLWSWHIWVTDYNPDPTGNVSVSTPITKRKQKYTYNNSDQLPMMDRNLGAMAGFTLSDPAKDVLEMSKANGLDYQWGRKDPFVGSYSAVPISIITGLTSATTPPKGMLNRFGPDGITYQPLLSSASKSSLRNAYQHPNTFYILNNGAIDWCSEPARIPTLWNEPNTDAGLKTVNDPCPAGWRVASYKHFYALFRTASFTENPNVANPATGGTDGGLYLYYTADGSGEASYYRLTGYHRYFDEYQFVGEQGLLWTREHTGATGKSNYGFCMRVNTATQAITSFLIANNWYPQDTHTVRCIQEQE